MTNLLAADKEVVSPENAPDFGRWGQKKSNTTATVNANSTDFPISTEFNVQPLEESV